MQNLEDGTRYPSFTSFLEHAVLRDAQPGRHSRLAEPGLLAESDQEGTHLVQGTDEVIHCCALQ